MSKLEEAERLAAEKFQHKDWNSVLDAWKRDTAANERIRHYLEEGGYIDEEADMTVAQSQWRRDNETQR